MLVTQQEGEELRTHVRSALGAHYLWMARLRAAAKFGTVDFDHEEVRHHDRCSIGKWLAHDIPKSLTYTSDYDRAKTAHAHFHETMASVIRMVSKGNLSGARAALESDGECAKAARELENVLKQWMVVGMSARLHSAGSGSTRSAITGVVR